MSEVNPRRHYIILRHYHTDFLKLYLAHLAILSSLGPVYDRVQVHCGVWAVYRPTSPCSGVHDPYFVTKCCDYIRKQKHHFAFHRKLIKYGVKRDLG